MNLVEQVKNQISGAMMNQLSSLIGANEGTTRTAVSAAVPALLSALSNVASSPGGVQKLLPALEKFDSGSLGNLGNMLSVNPNGLMEQGGGLLNSLLGGGINSGIANAVAKFSGLGSGVVQKLLSYLMPLILGGVAKNFVGKALNAQGLANLFADQKANIANALPSGLSLADVPGMAAAGSAVRSAAGHVQDTSANAMKWLVPLLALAAIALLAYLLWPKTTPGPTPLAATTRVTDVAGMTTDLTNTFNTINDSLSGITDAASAEKALPKLRDLNAKLDGLKTQMDQLPAEGRAKIVDLIKSNLGKLENTFAKQLWVPGSSREIKPVMNDTLGKMAALAGVPMPKLPQISGDLAETFSTLTETMGGIKDAASAQASLPKLREIDSKLDDMKGSVDQLSSTGKSTLSSLIKVALAKLKEVVDRVLATAGVGDQVRPVVDGIMGKLNTLAG
jgi:hypothetical protein